MAKKQKEPEWTPFQTYRPGRMKNVEQLGGQELHDAVMENTLIHVNNRYQVISRPILTGFGLTIELVIKSLRQSPSRDWRELQRIKNELVDPEAEAMELFPAESRLVDTCNVTYLFVLHPLRVEVSDDRFFQHFPQFPVGKQFRLVSEKGWPGSRQRKWRRDQKPEDLVDLLPEDVRTFFLGDKESNDERESDAGDDVPDDQRVQEKE